MSRVVFNFCSMLFCLASIALLAGCQQVAWKPGAGAAELNRDTAACRAQSDDDAIVKNCLRQRGWVLRSSAAGAAPEADSDDDSASNAASTASASAGEPAAITSTATTPTSTTPIVTTNVPARDKLVPASPASASAATSAATAPVTAQPKPTKKPKVIDPLTPKMIQSWWKVGAGAADLAADQAACVETLGPAHQPDLQKRLYTQGMIECLRARGWSGY